MNRTVYDDLFAEGLISEATFERLKARKANPVVSIHWELRTLLYLAVLLLTTGLGILVYKHIDTIGHQVILAVIALITTACFYWCFNNSRPFSRERIRASNSFFDYVLLLGTLSFLSFLGYLQFQYEVFGTSYGLATFIPAMVLFFIAYYFDHIGILNMAIVNFAVWMGVSLTPQQLMNGTAFLNGNLALIYITSGLMLLSAAHLSHRYNLKKHFFFSYHHYGLHLSMFALLYNCFSNSYGLSFLWLSMIAGLSWFLIHDAFRHRSFYFLLCTVVYSYIALSWMVVQCLSALDNLFIIYLGFLYFIGSGIAFIFMLRWLNEKIKQHDRL